MVFSTFDCEIIDIGVVHDNNGNISVLENSINIPFDIKRIYYLYDVPAGVERGGHAHYTLQQYVIAASGSFTFILDDGQQRREIFLNHPNKALHIKAGIWREMKDFASGSICLVFASQIYNEADYIRDYKEFKNFRNGTF